ncbi:YrhK family protein [Alteromonas sp. S015]|uniref:YrhK family protein n=1 Tax=Alteromonas sp. S015 TaxID=3117401 RepID=UPI002FDF3DAD
MDKAQNNKLGLAACLCFFCGSSLFLPAFSKFATVGVWLFMAGSLLMLFDILSVKRN